MISFDVELKQFRVRKSNFSKWSIIAATIREVLEILADDVDELDEFMMFSFRELKKRPFFDRHLSLGLTDFTEGSEDSILKLLIVKGKPK